MIQYWLLEGQPLRLTLVPALAALGESAIPNALEKYNHAYCHTLSKLNKGIILLWLMMMIVLASFSLQEPIQSAVHTVLLAFHYFKATRQVKYRNCVVYTETYMDILFA